MSAPCSALRARSLLPATVLALFVLSTAAAQAWPGLNGYMAYGSNRTGSAFSDDVYVSALDVESPMQLTFRRADDGQPAWSPDGRRLAFKTTQFGSNQLAVINADGTGETLLTRTFRFSEGQPAWSPDATKLLYRRTPENPLVQNGDIWVLDVEGSAKDPTQPVTQAVLLRTGDERYPSYSPDGTQIAFRGDLDLAEPSGDEELYVMNSDGTNVRQLTINADFDSAPSWSPDGKRILFERALAGTFTPGVEAQEKDVYVMRADGSHVRRLTDSPGLDEGPEFSPDGTKIAFSSSRDGQQEIYVMDADGSNPRRLTDNPARDESPDWQGLPFDTRGHRACGDVSLASGGASSVVAMRVPCHVARRLARRWTEAADAGAPSAKLKGLECTSTPHIYDLTVVACGSRKAPCARDIAFVWRDPARAPAPAAVAPQALAAPEGDAPPGDDSGDEGSAEAHEA
jgi:dipeptidyl aminopeptidase/acylaminoacyl peptidase